MKTTIKKVTKAMAKEIARQFFGHNKAAIVGEPQTEPARCLDDYVFSSGKTQLTIQAVWNTQEAKSPYITISMQHAADENEYSLVGEAEFIEGELKTKPYFEDCRQLIENLVFCLDNIFDNGEVDLGYLMQARSYATKAKKKGWW